MHLTVYTLVIWVCSSPLPHQGMRLAHLCSEHTPSARRGFTVSPAAWGGMPRRADGMTLQGGFLPQRTDSQLCSWGLFCKEVNRSYAIFAAGEGIPNTREGAQPSACEHRGPG